jgi:putative ABC transport system permease protein
MKRVFGLPAGPLSVWLAIILSICIGVVTVLAVRNLVFLKIGLRNIPRRPGRSALIVLGLMLGTTIIASSLLTGDTMATAVRASVVESLGVIDEAVTGGTSADAADLAGLEAAKPYFDARDAGEAVERATTTLPVDGATAAIIEPVAAQHRAGGRTAPGVTLFAPDAARAEQFGLGEVADLGPGEVLLNERAADELAASTGSTILLLAGDQLAELRVAGVGDYRGTTADGAAVIAPLRGAQDLLQRPGMVNHILVSNAGGETSGVRHTDAVETAIDEAVAELGLDAQPTKRDGLEAADATGNVFVSLFTTFGSFSMAAGILLIFLIFVMLAAERRPEMGMSRAVGTQRRHLVQSFLYEGAAYDLAAAAVGSVLGVGVSFVMVQAVASAFTEQESLDLSYSLSARSLLIAYAIGVLLTLAVVTASAWRVSRLNIVSAIRDIPETVDTDDRRRRWVYIVSGIVLGGLMAASGAAGQVFLPWMLGVSIVIISLVTVVKAVGGSERLAYSAAGAFLLVWWMLPLSTFDSIFGEMSKDFSIWIASGLVIVVAATWLVTYNADVVLGVASWLAAPFRSWRPVAKMAVAYPLRSRFRTGVTMAMFMLVVFTLVTGSTIPTAFIRSFDDVDRFGGGFDVRAMTAPAAAVTDLRAELPDEVASDVESAGAQSFVPVEARQAGTGTAFARYPVRGVDDGFARRSTYEFAALATGYDTPREVWSALSDTPGLAVVDPFVAPRRDQWGFAIPPDFQLSGFYVEDREFAPVPVVVHDPLTDTTVELTVIGVLSDNVPFDMAGITVSQRTLEPFGERALPTIHHFAVDDGVDPDTFADSVEASLLARGVEAETYQSLLDDAVSGNMLFIRLVQGFMALGLVVGVAALGVISARAVVERRQQLGMLRAIGFQPEMIRRTLLTETSIVAMTAIVAGSVLGLILSYNVIADAQNQLSTAQVTFAVPWLNLAVIFAAVIVASLLTTLLSAFRATRIYPAEALRYR